MDKKLFIHAGGIVVESKLSGQAKLQLINWIKKEATEAQIKAFLLDGKITALDEQSEEVVNDRFKGSDVQQMLEFVEPVSAMTMALAAAGLLKVWALYRVQSSQKQKRCGAFRIGGQTALCMSVADADEARKKIALLTKARGACSKAKNPAKCSKSADIGLAKMKLKLAKFMKKIEMAKAKGKKVDQATQAARTPGTRLFKAGKV